MRSENQLGFYVSISFHPPIVSVRRRVLWLSCCRLLLLCRCCCVWCPGCFLLCVLPPGCVVGFFFCFLRSFFYAGYNSCVHVIYFFPASIAGGNFFFRKIDGWVLYEQNHIKVKHMKQIFPVTALASQFFKATLIRYKISLGQTPEKYWLLCYLLMKNYYHRHGNSGTIVSARWLERVAKVRGLSKWLHELSKQHESLIKLVSDYSKSQKQARVYKMAGWFMLNFWSSIGNGHVFSLVETRQKLTFSQWSL